MRVLPLTIFAIAVLTGPAAAQDRVKIVEECSSLPVCFEEIGRTLPERDTGRVEGGEKEVARILKSRFGRAARDALLQKAVGDHGGWRNYAGGVLQYWKDWSEDDVPLLRRALQLNSGGWIANVLAEIGSPAAIEALVDDLVKAGFESQTGWALFRVGPDVLPHLLSAMQTDDEEASPNAWPDRADLRGAFSLIREFRSKATVIADEWISIARNRREPRSRRIAALRGLAAMNGYLGARTASLRPLLKDRDRVLAAQAYETLVETYDPTVARKLAASCKPGAGQWDEHALQSFYCLVRLSRFGFNATLAGDLVLPFLKSKNKAEQLYGIEILGLIGYRPAIPAIESFLQSRDWRHVYMAVRALAQLRSRESVEKIEAATENFWLSEVQLFGERAARLLVMNQPYSELLGGGWRPRGFGAYRYALDSSRRCKSGVWTYDGRQLSFERPGFENETRVSLPDGELIATHYGEFGGSLIWRPKSGKEVTLVDRNTSGIFPAGDGFVTIHGLAHLSFSYGFAVLVTRNENNQFSAREIARFPAAGNQVKKLDKDLFAANAGGRVVIFSTKGIIAEARCDYSGNKGGTTTAPELR